MAEEITKAQQESNLPAQKDKPDPIVDEMISLSEPKEQLGPATAENQLETQKLKEFDSEVLKKRKHLARSTGRDVKSVSEVEAQDLMLRDIEKKESEAAKQLQKQEEEDLAKKAEVDLALQRYQELKDKFAERELPFKVDSKFETLIAQKEQSSARKLQEVQQVQQEELQKQEQLAQAEHNRRVALEEETIKQQSAQQEAEANQHRQKIQATAERQKKLQDEILAEDEKMQRIDPNRFWNSKTTGEKILAGIGLVLAGIGSGITGQPNAALQVIQNQIDEDIKSQKLNNEQVLAKKKHALKLVELELKKLDSSTTNKLKKVQIAKMINDMQQGQLMLQQQRLMAKKLASQDGLTREEVLSLDREDQKRVVPVGSRNFIAFNAEVAKKLNNDVIPSAKSSLRGLGRLKEILEMPAAEVRPTLVAEAATIKQALKGNLRLELFGPGVMTDFESKMADKIIGDPTKILTFDMAERAKFNALIKKIKFSTRDKIKQAGINIPDSKNERMIKQMQKNNPKMKRELIIDALIRKGFWQEDDLGI